MRDYSKRTQGARPRSPAAGKPAWSSSRWSFRRWPFRRKVIAAGFLLLLIFTGFLSARHYWREHRWRWIVVHHTASDVGNLEYYRRLHREERGWRDIAYHFLINNGSLNTAVGQVEESALWKDRESHFSTQDTYVNVFGIAVVLVGNFEKHKVPDLQREALIKLLANLSREYAIPPEKIVGHREIWSTACPGKNLNMADLRTDIEKFLKEHPQAD